MSQIVWLSTYGWYGEQVTGWTIFSTQEEAIKDAICNAMGDVKDWNSFPSRGKYPYEDRDGNENPVLTPLFRVTWDSNGGGYAEVTKCEISDKFISANIQDVEVIYQKIINKSS